MKFGLESEKFLFDLKHNKPSEGALRYLEALSDLTPHTHSSGCITNEFVLNMVEVVTAPSSSPLEVIKDYLQSFESIKLITQREHVALVGLGSLPIKYQPHMIPKLKYFVQNSILDQRIEPSWIMDDSSPLTPAGNCAGIHIHSEIQTPVENLYSTRELQDKFNMGLMLTPMVAFSSSPFFFGQHEASSMRSHRYFNGVYRSFPLNGGLPPVMNSSMEVLQFTNMASQSWLSKGLSLGLPESELYQSVSEKGANWNPIRWNKAWNTIELRCLDSDRIDFDCAKFIWVTAAMKRLDTKGEGLICDPMEDKSLDHELIEKCFSVSDGKVLILNTIAIKELFQRATLVGIQDPFVSHYLERIAEFSKSHVVSEGKLFFELLADVLKNKNTTSENVLNVFGRHKSIGEEEAIKIIRMAIANDEKQFRELTQLKSLSFATIQNKDLFEPKDLQYP